jgi:hypothetical protein
VRLLEEARGILAPGGNILLEIGASQGMLMLHHLQELGYEHANIVNDFRGLPRIATAVWNGTTRHHPPRNRRSAELGGRRIYRRPKMGKQWLMLIPFGILAGYLQHRGWTARAQRPGNGDRLDTIIVATKEVTCPHCVGEDGMPKGGRRHPDNLNLWEDCPVCFGAGRRIIKAPNASNQQICPRCGGMGRYVQDARVTPASAARNGDSSTSPRSSARSSFPTKPSRPKARPWRPAPTAASRAPDPPNPTTPAP